MEEIIERWTQAHRGHARWKGLSAEQPLSPSMREEFKFIAHVTQYIKFIYQYSKASTKPGHFSLPDNVLLLGPHFVPPTPHIVSRHCKIPLVLEPYTTLSAAPTVEKCQRPLTPCPTLPIIKKFLLNGGPPMDLVASMVLMKKSSLLDYRWSARSAKQTEVRQRDPPRQT